jgi:2-aminoethylphosphonate-pyruvate transaminase
MRALGFKTFLPDDLQAPIIVTFHSPADPRYDFSQFYRRVRDRGFILYPGKLTAVDTFRVGCIGAIGPNALRRAVAAIADVLQEMEVRRIAL